MGEQRDSTDETGTTRTAGEDGTPESAADARAANGPADGGDDGSAPDTGSTAAAEAAAAPEQVEAGREQSGSVQSGTDQVEAGPVQSGSDEPDEQPTAGVDGAAKSEKKGLKSVRDMVLSMAVIGLGALLLYSTLPNDESQDPVYEITYEAELATAGRAAPYELLSPEGLGDKWRATSVSYKANSDHGSVWHLGFMNPSDEYAAVEQGNGDERKFVHEVTQGASETETTETVNGEEWVRYTGEKYNALVLKRDADASDRGNSSGGSQQDGEVTTVVTGTASYASLKKLAASLEPPQTAGN
ncbi:DUF4245 domain-containing protein [Streptomyces sp. XM4193]|uniref:DUF4245 domain-containing protein n=1 Tax=Streptomyces sp. XM4193 TaxID=2929782 RepID=UPI001FF9BD6C|nr:DUF4245 domain-containing protein [Streptomyces sp. XM4193]MCK1795983.1 DUF4245 domain-containing protein [Streptomyces sp. XM4193]